MTAVDFSPPLILRVMASLQPTRAPCGARDMRACGAGSGHRHGPRDQRSNRQTARSRGPLVGQTWARRVPNLKLLPLVLIRPRAGPAEEDIRAKVVDGVGLQHTSAARTVTDCFQFRTRVGVDVAVSALHAVRKAGVASMDDIWRCAKGAGVAEVMLPYLEAID